MKKDNWFKRFIRGFKALDVHKKLAWFQLFLYVLILVFNIVNRVFENAVTINTSIIFVIKFSNFVDVLLLVIRILTLVLGVMQIVYGVRDKFMYAWLAGGAALVQSLPISYIPFFAAMVALGLNVVILVLKY